MHKQSAGTHPSEELARLDRLALVLPRHELHAAAADHEAAVLEHAGEASQGWLAAHGRWTGTTGAHQWMSVISITIAGSAGDSVVNAGAA